MRAALQAQGEVSIPRVSEKELHAFLHAARAVAAGKENFAGFRMEYIQAGVSLTPPPQAVVPLLSVWIESLRCLTEQAKHALDDLYLALFAFYGVVEIHPYADGNGRTARALFEQVLALRWGDAYSGLPKPEPVHDVLGHILTRRVERSDDHSAGGIILHLNSVVESLSVRDLGKLQQCSAMQTGAAYVARLLKA